MSPEQQAIRQFLSKPAPTSSGCGCMGPQPIDRSDGKRGFSYTICVSSFGQNRLKVASLLRKISGMSYSEIKPLLDKDSAEIEYSGLPQTIADFHAAGATVVHKKIGPNMEPLCPCAMDFVELVEGNYYLIDEHRSPDGITHTAILVGPKGGPYINVR